MMDNRPSDRPLKVHFICTGVDQFRGGIETFFREAFNGLQGMEGVHIELYKRDKRPAPGEVCIPSISRRGRLARGIAAVTGRSPYAVEQVMFLPGYALHLRRKRPDVIFSSDGNLLLRLPRMAKRLGVPVRLVYSNGAPVGPPYDIYDHVQQVTPLYMDKALQAGEPAWRNSLVPYGIAVPPGDPLTDAQAVTAVRRQLGLPLDRKILLSVGWISAEHKRMDYLVREIAALPEPRPFLVMLGRMDESSSQIVQLAEALLGRENLRIGSVPYEQTAPFYQAADLFVLASLLEGFGRVFLEAMIHGLRCVAHDYPVTRYVLGEKGVYADLSREGTLSAVLSDPAVWQSDPAERIAARQSVRDRFSWEALKPVYREMFLRCANRPPIWWPK